MGGSTKSAFIEELKAMKERMEEIFLRNFETEGQQPVQETRSSDWSPATDIVDTGGELVYLIDLPGVREDELQVECREDRLWVSGSRNQAVPEGNPLHTERSEGRFSRVFKLPCAIEEDNIRAELQKGVLRIFVPKTCSTGRPAQRIAVRQED